MAWDIMYQAISAGRESCYERRHGGTITFSSNLLQNCVNPTLPPRFQLARGFSSRAVCLSHPLGTEILPAPGELQ